MSENLLYVANTECTRKCIAASRIVNLTKKSSGCNTSNACTKCKRSKWPGHADTRANHEIAIGTRNCLDEYDHFR